VRTYIDKLSIKTPSLEQQVRFLSGGNQQKVILARWLAANPKLIILDEPTRGIDVGAKQEIEKLILSFANRGISVIYITSEIPELIRNCDRVIVFKDGISVGELVGNEISEDNIMATIARDYKRGGNEA
ncbi:MAG: ATP-binding cassette domain-containing protein, partial [Clostridia bacterium]|nr:ATP-binding cassette domain-containing protein [Clostridia bacterium]